MREDLSHEDWKALEGGVFAVRFGDAVEQDWTLESVLTWGDAAQTGRQPYTLSFSGPRAPYASQGLCRLRHDALGVVDVFIVPNGPSREGAMRYEAIFS